MTSKQLAAMTPAQIIVAAILARLEGDPKQIALVLAETARRAGR